MPSQSGIVPYSPQNIGIRPGNGQITVSWDSVQSAALYNLYWSTSAGVTKNTGTKISNITTRSYTHTGLSNGQTYYYIVTAVNSYGEGNATGAIYANPSATGTPPAAQISLAASSGNEWISISWPDATTSTSYNLYWSTSPGVTKSTGTKIANVTSPYLHTALTNGITYYYVVASVNSYGESSASGQVSAVPQSTYSYYLIYPPEPPETPVGCRKPELGPQGSGGSTAPACGGCDFGEDQYYPPNGNHNRYCEYLKRRLQKYECETAKNCTHHSFDPWDGFFTYNCDVANGMQPCDGVYDLYTADEVTKNNSNDNTIPTSGTATLTLSVAGEPSNTYQFTSGGTTWALHSASGGSIMFPFSSSVNDYFYIEYNKDISVGTYSFNDIITKVRYKDIAGPVTCNNNNQASGSITFSDMDDNNNTLKGNFNFKLVSLETSCWDFNYGSNGVSYYCPTEACKKVISGSFEFNGLFFGSDDFNTASPNPSF